MNNEWIFHTRHIRKGKEDQRLFGIEDLFKLLVFEYVGLKKLFRQIGICP